MWCFMALWKIKVDVDFENIACPFRQFYVSPLHARCHTAILGNLLNSVPHVLTQGGFKDFQKLKTSVSFFFPSHLNIKMCLCFVN